MIDPLILEDGGDPPPERTRWLWVIAITLILALAGAGLATVLAWIAGALPCGGAA